MFSVLVAADGMAWETDDLMAMERGRFKEHSESEAEFISLNLAHTLKSLEEVPALLMYEHAATGPNTDIVRFGYLRNIATSTGRLTFRFDVRGHLPASLIWESPGTVGMTNWELNRTHWAVKNGDVPSALLAKMTPIYELVLSFAGEDRNYVKQVAAYLKQHEVTAFYDRDEEANLWGKDLAEHLHLIYRSAKRFCVMFISKHYAEKMWAIHERRAALERAIEERHQEYILPARFDDTEIPGIRRTVGYVDLRDRSPEGFGALLLEKLGRHVPHEFLAWATGKWSLEFGRNRTEDLEIFQDGRYVTSNGKERRLHVRQYEPDKQVVFEKRWLDTGKSHVEVLQIKDGGRIMEGRVNRGHRLRYQRRE